MDKFFPRLLKALAAAGAAAVVIVAQALIAFFSGTNPSDVSPTLWGIVGAVAVLALNFVISKLPPRA